jgi:hypothetical protein
MLNSQKDMNAKAKFMFYWKVKRNRCYSSYSFDLKFKKIFKDSRLHEFRNGRFCLGIKYLDINDYLSIGMIIYQQVFNIISTVELKEDFLEA